MAPENSHQETMSSQDSAISRLQKAARNIPPRRPTGATTDNFIDSGYSSQSTTPSKKQPGSCDSSHTLLYKKRKIWLVEQPISQVVKDRFKEIQPHFERLLLEEIRVRQKPGMRYKPMSTRLAMMGISEDDARPHIVVLCHSEQRSHIQAFVKKDIVVDIFRPKDPNVPALEVAVIGNAPQLRLARSNIEVVTDAEHILTGTIGSTLCGIPISLQHPNGQRTNARLGGLIKIVTASGDIEILGMTAGHAVSQDDEDDRDVAWHRLDIGEFESDNITSPISDDQQVLPRDDTILESGIEEEADVDDSDIEMEYIVCLSEETSDAIIDARSESWKFLKPAIVGQVVEPSRDKDTSHRKDYDWALLQPTIYKMNHIPIDWKAQLSVSERRPGAAGNINVIVLGGFSGYRIGSLLGEPGRILLGGEEFVDTFMVNVIDNGPGIRDGDSGSWVIDTRSFEVYGQLVASDIFGSGYVIPMTDIFDDIKSRLGARAVELPSYLDILHARTVAQAKNLSQSPDPNNEGAPESDESKEKDSKYPEEEPAEKRVEAHKLTPHRFHMPSLVVATVSRFLPFTHHGIEVPKANCPDTSTPRPGCSRSNAIIHSHASRGDIDDDVDEVGLSYDSGYESRWVTPK